MRLLLFTLVYFTVVLLSIGACHNKEPIKPFTYETELASVNNGKHTTRQSGSFFLFFGSFKGGETKRSIMFAWKLRDDYIFSQVGIDKVRLRFDNNVESPKIKLVFLNSFLVVSNEEDLIENPNGRLESCLSYVVIVCKRKQWNPVFELPLSKKIKRRG